MMTEKDTKLKGKGQEIIIKILKYFYDREIERFIVKGNTDELYVTDLLNCSNLFYLRKQLGIAIKLEDISNDILRSHATIGNIFHEGIQKILKETVENVNTEFSVEKIFLIDDKMVKLKGRIDVYIKDENLPIEIKFTVNPQNLPRTEHVFQLRTYMNIVNSDKGLLIYITPAGIKYFEINNPLTDVDLINQIKIILENKQIKREQCKYCLFKKSL
jgi:RecB family exonuclease